VSAYQTVAFGVVLAVVELKGLGGDHLGDLIDSDVFSTGAYTGAHSATEALKRQCVYKKEIQGKAAGA